MHETEELEYVGFWLRVWASLIDSILVAFLTIPLLMAIYGEARLADGVSLSGMPAFFISYLLPAIAVLVFWTTKHATPGKMAIGAKIVDANTGHAPTLNQHFVRYIGYFVSIFPLCLGLLWIGFDRKKQGWHDKLAGTVVVRRKYKGKEQVRFSH